MHSTKFLAAILAVAGTGLAMPLEAPIATPASPSAVPAVEGLKESWVGCDNGHCPPEDPSPWSKKAKERWAAKKAKMPKKTSKPKDLSPEEFEKEVDEFWAEKIQKFKERLAAKKANTPESPPKPADSPCNKDKRDAAVDAACATDDDGFRKLSPEAISAILNAAPGPVVAKSMTAAADKILPNEAVEKIRGRPGPGVVAPTAAFSGPLKLTKRPARTSSATGTPTASSATGTSTASSAAGIPTTPSATGSSTAATATGTTTPKVTSVGVTGTPARPSATGTATGTTAPTKAHLAARDYPSNFADLVRVGPQIEKKTALSKRGRITRIPVLDAATRERLIREGEIIVLTGKRKPGTKPKHHQS
ncbi:hypothetical protein CGCS363_v004226 [Colletotrichum siamense]|uniref:uncharacterized protein n=1 Tax=Colletotrichum siamense TaxID=690259 RepID=UPI001872D31B|nr:uncharacterized protein CGCS363_v004226 [Colletotrichum siamense]KAF5505526.1 hypothetical protein CGCS363_v004226 [Colletotrichum siamense]